jgi:hypothetical protein
MTSPAAVAAVAAAAAAAASAGRPESLFPEAGLPDGLFSYQKSQLGYILGGFGMENVGVLYDHL